MQRSSTINFLLSITLVILFLLFSYFRVFDAFELNTLDSRFKLRPTQAVDDNIVVIEVDDATLTNLNEWPLPRKYHALLLKALESAGVKDVVFDVFFSEETPDDDTFAEAVKESGDVYMPYIFSLISGKFMQGFPIADGFIARLITKLEKVCKDQGYINIIEDLDGKVRRVTPFVYYKGKFKPQLSVKVALDHMGYSMDDVKIFPGKKMIINDEIHIPLTEDSNILVNYPGTWEKTFRHYPYYFVVQSFVAGMRGEKPLMDLSLLKDSVCFVGVTAAAAPDLKPTPIGNNYPGVGVHASLYNSLIHHNFIRRLGRLGNVGVTMLLWFFAGVITVKTKKKLLASMNTFLLVLAYLVGAILLFAFAGLWIDVFYPIISVLIVYLILTFREYLEEFHKREIMEKELNIAKDIQQSFLPKVMPDSNKIEIYAEMLTAKQVGGDLYDALNISEDKVGLMLGDVSGKGVPAALFMAQVVSLFKTYAKADSVEEAVVAMNKNLSDENMSNLFVTLTYMVFETDKNKVTYASGGHNPALYIKATGETEWLDAKEGLPLGLLEGDYSTEEVEYTPGSIFVLYTDGVTEAFDIKGDMFGEERLAQVVTKLKDKSAKEICQSIQYEVAAFAGKAPQHDDITVMVIKV